MQMLTGNATAHNILLLVFKFRWTFNVSVSVLHNFIVESINSCSMHSNEDILKTLK